MRISAGVTPFESSVTQLSTNPRHPTLWDVLEYYGEQAEAGSLLTHAKALDELGRLEWFEYATEYGTWSVDVETTDLEDGYSETWTDDEQGGAPAQFFIPIYRYAEVTELERVTYSETTETAGRDTVYFESDLTADGCAPTRETTSWGPGYEESGETVSYRERAYTYDGLGRPTQVIQTAWTSEQGQEAGDYWVFDYVWSCPTSEDTDE
jgi:hypothetical protein